MAWGRPLIETSTLDSSRRHRRAARSLSKREKLLHLPEERLLGLRIDHVQTIFIDDHGLASDPLAPARLADLRLDLLTERTAKGRVRQPLAVLSALRAVDCRHAFDSSGNSLF